MASMERTPKKVAKTTLEPCVILTLSMEEAATLMEVTNYIGGSPTLSPRGHINAIRDALDEVNVPRLSNSYKISELVATGSIYFKDSDGCTI